MQINTALCTLYYVHIAIESTNENIFKEPCMNKRKQETKSKKYKNYRRNPQGLRL